LKAKAGNEYFKSNRDLALWDRIRWVFQGSTWDGWFDGCRSFRVVKQENSGANRGPEELHETSYYGSKKAGSPNRGAGTLSGVSLLVVNFHKAVQTVADSERKRSNRIYSLK
jgi:hypothetical protein